MLHNNIGNSTSDAFKTIHGISTILTILIRGIQFQNRSDILTKDTLINNMANQELTTK